MELEEMLEDLPENRWLVKDSGTWKIYDDRTTQIIYMQKVNETFTEFIKRCHEKENIWQED